MLGLFLRANHPAGYGMGGSTAHGYVVAIVRCETPEELAKVEHIFATTGLSPELTNRGDYWYAGQLDLVAVLPGNEPPCELSPFYLMNDSIRRKSIGDNRFAGFYDASEILGRP